MAEGTAVNPFAPGASSAPPPTLAPRAPGGGTAVNPFASSASSAQTASTAKAAPAKKSGGGGLFGRLISLAKAAPGGIEQLAKDVGKVTVGAGENLANDVGYLGSLGHWNPGLGGPSEDPTKGFIASPSQVAQQAKAQTPALYGIAKGGRQTFTELHDPGRLAANYSRDPLGSALNDVASLAMVAGPASGALRAASGGAEAGLTSARLASLAGGDVGAGGAAVEQAAARAALLGKLSRGANLTNAVAERGASLPLLPLQAAGRALGGAAGPLTARLAETGLGRAAVGLGERQAARAALDTQVRTPVLGALRDTALNIRTAARALGRDPEAEHALNLVQTGIVPAARAALAASVHDGGAALDALGVSEKAAKLATDFTDHALPAKQQAAFESALGTRGKLLGERTASYVSGEGSSALAKEKLAGVPAEDVAAHQAALSAQRAEQLGNQPMPSVVSRLTAEPRAAYEEAQAHAAQTVGTSAADVARMNSDMARSKLFQAEDKAAASTEATPARFTPAIEAGKTAVKSLHDTAAELDKGSAGAGDALRQAAAEVPTTLEALNRAGIDPQHLIGGKEPEARGPSLANTGNPVRVRKTGEESQKLTGQVPRTLAEAGKREADRARQVIQNIAAPQLQERFGKSVADVAPDLVGRAGADLAKAMEAQGFVAWDPSSYGGRVPVTSVTDKTLFIPEQMAKVFDDYWGGKDKSFLTASWDKLARTDKGLRIALSPSIHLAYMFGNMMYELPAVGPSLIPNLFKAAKLLRDEAKTGEAAAPARLAGTTFAGDLASELRSGSQGGRFGGYKTPLGLGIEKGYGLLGVGEKVQRLAVLLSKKGEGLSDEAALRQALSINGDFSRMTPIEQNIMKRVFPGYAWARHITGLAMKLPIEHPLRVAWMLNLARVAPGQTAPWWLNPFDSAFQVARLHPGIRALLALTGQQQVGASAIPISHPATTGPTGQRVSLLGHPGELAHVLERFVPQGKLAQALLQRPVVRYGTGEPKVTKSSQQIAQPGGKLGESLRALSLIGPPAQPPPLKTAIAKSDTAAAKAKLSYQRRLKASQNRKLAKG